MKELDRRLKVMDIVIRHMIVRVDEDKKVVDRDADQAADRTRSAAASSAGCRRSASRAKAARPASRTIPDDDRFDGVEV